MFHHVAANVYRDMFLLASSPIAMIPADGDPLLKWLRNILLNWNYLFLYLSSFWVFWGAQIFYNDGKLFVTYWQMIMQE